MKKVIGLLVSAFVLSAGTVFAQSEIDAYKFSQTDLSGTARYMGMGGAFGALGGDISSMETNPAGLGIYRSSEVVTTLSLSSIRAKTDWVGTKMNENRTKLNFDNIAYVGYFPSGNDEGLVSWNVGFSYNRVKNYNRTYRMGRGAGGKSISDYIAELTSLNGSTSGGLWGTDNYDPYLNHNWLSVLGYNAGLIDGDKGAFFSTMGEWKNGNLVPFEVHSADLHVTEKGAVDKYNISLATNISNVFFVGATVSVTDLNYDVRTYYDEDFGSNEASNKSDHLYLDNYSSLDGTGYGFNLGVIVRPVNFLRFGVAYNSPTWYKMTNYYNAEAGAFVYNYYSNKVNPEGNDKNMDRTAWTPDNVYTEYKLRSADKFLFSAAAIIGQTALISVDYELTNYKGMRLSDRDGYAQDDDNSLIKGDYRWAGMLKAGAEVKVTPQFAVRVGTAWQNSPVQDHMKYTSDGVISEVSVSGTRTVYSVDHSVNYYTLGLGYRFTPNFYVDLAAVYRMQKEEVYPFPHLIEEGKILVESVPSILKTNTTKVALTFGYKF